ncbi:glutathione ABC transporter membrane subunit GsiC [Paraburkholderia unamae]|uniref:ABC transporter permease n=1 Tax=Paraburkholderia unamae TaxID=219649 RepID=UPI001CAF8F99|nr:ABC transporter permease [Paraburkholderia unamae]CAG9254789.1 glutathione ABC transporter membrane subunit GsiC [Paraburkholderia unamae]
MTAYLLRRVGQSCVTVLLVIAMIFVVVRMIGDPTHLMLPPEATEADRQVLRQQMGLDKPIPVQFAHFLGQLSHGDFGSSYRFSRPALPVIMQASWPTLQLTLASMGFALLIGLPAGIAGATRPDGWADQIGKLIAAMGQAVPPFLFGLLFVKLFSLHWHWLPTSGYGGGRFLLMPALALGWYVAAGVLRLTRASMISALEADYVRFARLKGMPEHIVIWRHALRNALLPVLTFLSLQFGVLMGGAVSVEVVFGWPGIGQLLYDSINNLDYTVVQAAVAFAAVVFALLNLAVDVLYAALDPRIRYA